ncbi:uncharacterized protein LOC132034911 [Lycium ferocissimum]|uniref:uncharacterized protein LOC132034911 n=1 Tax=Lycium ferocissimum TaxID=112874 RepID=UPI002814F8B9|nr:uncharacterized protein LOC132034911 [Lycium ferocissimum]
MFEDFVFDVAPSHLSLRRPLGSPLTSASTGGRRHTETTSYSPPHPSQEPTQAPVDTQVHPSAPEVATPDEVEFEIPDLTQPEVLSVPAGPDPKKKHVLVKGARARQRDDDHGLERPVIKRKKGDGDDDEGSGDGMSLRPRDSLRHTTCGTHPR